MHFCYSGGYWELCGTDTEYKGVKVGDIMKISLCMIVKNEEALLLESLSAMGRYVDEIIVVDTGSTDRTKEIALGCTEKVYDFTWCDDFSAARNFAIAKASHDWVLVLDADEIITLFQEQQIEGVMKADNPIVGRIKLINRIADATGEKRYNERISRLFNRRMFRYEGCIHEQIVQIDGEPYDTVNVDITVEHSGYTEEVMKRTDKIMRNIHLLQRSLERSPEDTYLLYQLGKSHSLAKIFTESIQYFTKALGSPLDYSLEYVAELVQSYGYALLNSKRYEEAMCLTSYEQYYKESPDFLFLLGLIYMNNGMFVQAIKTFSRCRGNKQGKTEGINSWLPAYNIAVIYECLGNMAEATLYYEQCGNYELAVKRLGSLEGQA